MQLKHAQCQITPLPRHGDHDLHVWNSHSVSLGRTLAGHWRLVLSWL